MKEKRFNWPTWSGLAVIHICALAAFIPGTFSWSALTIAVVIYYLTGGIGISLGYHRLLTHRSLTVPKCLENFKSMLGTLALQGGPNEWVSTHPIHHAHTDTDEDPHDAHRGLIWTHVDWLYRPNKNRPSLAERERYAKDLWSDPVYQAMERLHMPLQIALGVALFAAGGWPWLIWGIFVRLSVLYHVTWFVNSAAHRFGYQTYDTGDKSTNCWWVGVLTWGEGWHNNHHAFPFSARHGMQWYEFEPTRIFIKVLRVLGVARDVKLPSAAMRAKLKKKAA
jgi:stearoyl-CoA desaturase (delta-9 desaturase)